MRVLKDVTIKRQTVTMGTSGAGGRESARILNVLRMFLLPVLCSSQPPPLSSGPRPFCGLSSFSSRFHSLLLRSRSPSWTMRQDGAPGRSGRIQERQQDCARTCSGAGGWGRDVKTLPRPRWSLRPWSHSAFLAPGEPGSGGGGAAAVAKRAGAGGAVPGACLGLGAGGGAERPGQPGLDGEGEAMASAELQGKYQKLAQEYSKVPIVGGESGVPGPAASGCLGSDLSLRRGTAERACDRAPPLSSASSVHHYRASTCSSQEMGPGGVWVRVRFCGREQQFVSSFSLNQHAWDWDVRNPGFCLWCWWGEEEKGEDHSSTLASSVFPAE